MKARLWLLLSLALLVAYVVLYSIPSQTVTLTHEVATPGGVIYAVKAPEGTTVEDVLQYAQQYHSNTSDNDQMKNAGMVLR